MTAEKTGISTAAVQRLGQVLVELKYRIGETFATGTQVEM
jgi:hypothetical protein